MMVNVLEVPAIPANIPHFRQAVALLPHTMRCLDQVLGTASATNPDAADCPVPVPHFMQ